jgi:hypothetical protein
VEILRMREISTFLCLLLLAIQPAFSADPNADLRERRDRDVDLLERGLVGEPVFDEVRRINRKFKEDFRTVQLFQMLDEKNPTLARQCFRHVRDVLLDGNPNDRALFRKYAGDLFEYLQHEIDSASKMNATRDRNPSDNGAWVGEAMKSLKCLKLEKMALKLADLSNEHREDPMIEKALRHTASKMHIILCCEKPAPSLSPLLGLFKAR